MLQEREFLHLCRLTSALSGAQYAPRSGLLMPLVRDGQPVSAHENNHGKRL
jgi:hypothetical protein